MLRRACERQQREREAEEEARQKCEAADRRVADCKAALEAAEADAEACRRQLAELEVAYTPRASTVAQAPAPTGASEASEAM